MLIPLLFTLFWPNQSFPSPQSHDAPHKRIAIVKGEMPLVMPSPQAPVRPAARRLHHRRMTLKASLRLETSALEEPEEADLIAAINTERTARGLGALTEDPLLTETARIHSLEMSSLNYFDHHSPTPGQRTPLARYLTALNAWGEEPPDSAIVGENIFYASVTDAVYNVRYAHQRLMTSPAHRSNILEPRFTKIGVGLYRDSQGRFWITEMFLRDTE